MIKKIHGLTLLEMMLVLAIISAILLVGIRVYRYIQFQSEVAIVKQNVDDLFLALKLYYQANCGQYYDPSSQKMKPKVYSFLAFGGSQFPIDINTTLKKAGYLPATWPRRSNLAIDYYAQFARAYFGINYDNQTRYIPADRSCTGSDCNPRPIKAEGPGLGISGSVLLFKAQVGVQLANNAIANTYFGLFGAACITAYDGYTINQCVNAPVGGSVLLLEKLPSSFAATSGSQLWPSDARAKQFSRGVLTNDDFYALQASDNTYNEATGYQYYLCGS